MVEYLRDIKVTIDIETNKRSIHLELTPDEIEEMGGLDQVIADQFE